MNFERKGVNPLLLVFLAISGVNPLTCRITELEDIFPFFRILRTVMLQYHERGVNPLSWCCSCSEFGEYHERGVNPLSGCYSFGGFGNPRGQEKGTMISSRETALATKGWLVPWGRRAAVATTEVGKNGGRRWRNKSVTSQNTLRW